MPVEDQARVYQWAVRQVPSLERERPVPGLRRGLGTQVEAETEFALAIILYCFYVQSDLRVAGKGKSLPQFPFADVTLLTFGISGTATDERKAPALVRVWSLPAKPGSRRRTPATTTP